MKKTTGEIPKIIISVLLCAAVSVYFCGIADSRTRATGFNDTSPALSIETQGSQINISVFGSDLSLSVPKLPEQEILESAADLTACTVPPVLRLFANAAIEIKKLF